MYNSKALEPQGSMSNKISPNHARLYIEDMLQEMETMAEALDMKDVSTLLKITLNVMQSEALESRK